MKLISNPVAAQYCLYSVCCFESHTTHVNVYYDLFQTQTTEASIFKGISLMLDKHAQRNGYLLLQSLRLCLRLELFRRFLQS